MKNTHRAILALTLTLVGCGDCDLFSTLGEGDPNAHEGTDNDSDVDMDTDTDTDTDMDTDTDTETDTDSDTDTDTDAGIDAGTDTGTDAGTDAGANGVDGGREAETVEVRSIRAQSSLLAVVLHAR